MSSFKSTLKYGFPFLCFMVLGSFMLREFTSIRYDVHKFKRRYGTIRPNEREDMEYSDSEQVADEIQSLERLGANNEWQNIRGPRPWEDNSEYEALMNKLKAKNMPR